MDVRRYNHNRDAAVSGLSLSNKTLPGLVVLAVGIVVLITGLILFAAFGVPKGGVPVTPKNLSGVIVVGIAVLICVVGVIMSVVLRKNAREAKREARRQQREAQEQEQQQVQNTRKTTRVPPVPYSDPQHQTVSYMVNSKRHEQEYDQSAYQTGSLYTGNNGYYDSNGYSTRVDS